MTHTARHIGQNGPGSFRLQITPSGPFEVILELRGVPLDLLLSLQQQGVFSLAGLPAGAEVGLLVQQQDVLQSQWDTFEKNEGINPRDAFIEQATFQPEAPAEASPAEPAVPPVPVEPEVVRSAATPATETVPQPVPAEAPVSEAPIDAPVDPAGA